MAAWHQFRTVEEFKRHGLNLSTSNDTAAKCLDAIADQYCAYADNVELDGMEGTFRKLYAADPNCVMGRIMECAVQLISTGRSVRLDSDLRNRLSTLIDESHDEKSCMTPWERQHVRALQLFSNGYIEAACDTWERILLDCPLDIFALRLAHDSYFLTSRPVQIRDSVTRVFPYWNRSMVLYRHLFGMISFGLFETHRYAESEKYAMEGLQFEPSDGWATHSVAHVKEMTVQYDSGSDFLLERRPLWSVASGLAVHLDWHYCLFRMEKADYEPIFRAYDDSMIKRLQSPKCAILDIVDGTSLLYRLEMEGQNVGDRWAALSEICEKHLKDHVTLFNDAHYLMAFLGAGRHAQRDEQLRTLHEYLNDESDVVSMKGIDEAWQKQLLRNVSSTLSHATRQVGKQLGEQLLNGMCLYAAGDYDLAFEQLFPIRSDIDSSAFGGSHAQRDVFKQLVIHACLKSPKYRCTYARNLLYERLGQRPGSPLTQRLVSKLDALEMPA